MGLLDRFLSSEPEAPTPKEPKPKGRARIIEDEPLDVFTTEEPENL